jgi:hypothetical protein
MVRNFLLLLVHATSSFNELSPERWILESDTKVRPVWSYTSRVHSAWISVKRKLQMRSASALPSFAPSSMSLDPSRHPKFTFVSIRESLPREVVGNALHNVRLIDTKHSEAYNTIGKEEMWHLHYIGQHSAAVNADVHSFHLGRNRFVLLTTKIF